MRSPRSVITVAALLLLGVPLLAGCTTPPDAATQKQALTEVTQDPTPPEAAEELDVDVEPEPVVEPVECTRYLLITARGTGEPPKRQLLGPVTRAVSESRPDEMQTVDLDYPADTDVKEGGTVGVRTLVDTLNVQAEACPEQQFVLLGYSQGALVIGDALADPEYRLVGTTVGQLDAGTADRILAIVMFGDPRFVGSEPFASGSFSTIVNGLLPRPPGALDAFADRIRDFCVAKDFVCQSTFNLDEEGHVAYYDNGMQREAATFVLTKLPPLKKPSVTQAR